MRHVDERGVVALSIPAKAEYVVLCRLALAGIARVRAVEPETVADLKLALTEACSNSVRHAYGDAEGHVAISFELRDDRLIVEVADDGTGFVPLPADEGDGELTEGGLGIAIIRALTDELDIGSQPGGKGSRLRFVKILARV